MKLKNSLKFRIVAGVILVIVLGATIAPVLFFPARVKAQGGVALPPVGPGIPVTVTGNLPESTKSIWDVIKGALKTAGYIAFRNTLNLILGQVAQQTAEWIASGAPGQGPMFWQDPMHFAENVGDSALGDLLDTFAKEGGLASQSLCDINPQLKLNILANLDPIFVQKNFSPKTHCSFTEMLENAKSIKWDEVVSVGFAKGPAGQYEANLSTLIANDTRLKQSQKLALTKIVTKISAMQRLFTATMKPLEDPATAKEYDMESVSSEIKSQLEGMISIYAPPAPSTPSSEYLQFWELSAPVCLAKKQQDFCQEQNCYSAMCSQDSPSLCNTQFNIPILGDCLNVTRRVNDYTKQIVDWYNILANMMKNTADSIDEGAYAPPKLADLNDLNTMFNPGASDLSVAVKIQGNVLQAQADAINKASFWRQITGPINDVTGKINNIINTPSTLVSEEARQAVTEGTASLKTVTGEALADALSTFTGTLANKLMDKIKQGLNPKTNPDAQRNTPFLFGDQISNPGQAGARAIFADLATVTLKRGGKVDILTEFTNNQNCSDPGITPTSNNCTIDDSFRQAVTQQLTIREALVQNLLHGDWKVGAVGIKDTNQDYASRYSLNNIKKLRRARIVPLGLEIAAQKVATSLNDVGYTLKQVVDGFNDTTTGCTENGVFVPGEGCFYHLVDPDWVLKTPDLRCDAMVYSAIPVNGTSQRQQACVDMKDCISENNKGECLAYGYCAREKNIWVMGGDQCDSQYSSCQNYVRAVDHYNASYVKSTLDFSTCDQNNAGCKWYCDRFTLLLGANNQDTWACTQPGSSLSKTDWGKGQCEVSSKQCVGGSNPGVDCTRDPTVCSGGFCKPAYYQCKDSTNAIYFNRQVETCNSQSEGCTQWISAMPNTGANLLPNGSFEQYSGTLGDTVNGWKIEAPPHQSQFIVNRSLAQNGTVVAEIAPNDDWGKVQFMPGDLASNWPKFLMDNYSYTISLAVNNRTDEKQTVYLFANYDPIHYTELFRQTLNKNSGWQTLSYNFTQPLSVIGFDGEQHVIDWTTLRWEVGKNFIPTSKFVYFDSLQLEARQTASIYKDYASSGQLYFKKAPDYLKCYNRNSSNGALITTDDEVSCAKYAVACNRDEVGCDLYKSSNGDPALPAVARDADRCPAECVGYQTFRESNTNFSDGRSVVNLIPATGQTCSANEDGCSEFTNLDAVSKGGEGREYYSYIRTCRQPDNACSYYYTWVGSDTTGYQLQRYYLEKSGKPNYNGPDGVLWPYEAQKRWGACNDANDVLTNPHCKQFYDSAGVSYFMLYENTISCSTDCHPLRKTTLVTHVPYNSENPQPDYCPTHSISQVQIPGTSFNVNRKACVGGDNDGKTCTVDVDCPGGSCQDFGICTYMAIPSEGITCNKVNDGCRGYKGNAAYNVRQIFLDDFEGDSPPWTPPDPGVTLDPHSSESTYVGGHSLSVSASSRREVTIKRDVIGLLTAGKSYQISFWIKGATISVRAGITGNAPSKPILLGNNNNWQLVTIGPYYVNTLPKDTIQLSITTTPNIESHSDNDPPIYSYTYFIDNILLKEITDNIYLIQNSWTTPTSCDYKIKDNIKVFDSMVGCQTYTNHTNQTGYFRGFSSLCQQKAVGCEAMIDTYNSTNAFGENFSRCIGGDKNGQACTIDTDCPPVGVGHCNQSTIISADSIEYLINDSTKSCAAADRGCQRFGLPSLTRASGQADYKVTGWSDKFLKNNPDLYTQKPTLCQANGMGCEEFLPQGASTPVYFKDPGDGLCEYKENTGAGAQTGWFKKGTTDSCYKVCVGGPNSGKICSFDSYCGSSDSGFTCSGDYQSGGIFGIKNFGYSGYSGLAGLCPKNQSGCKKFVDPLATTSPYYYLDNAKLNQTTCTGVSQKQGCVLLDDKTQTTKTSNARASYNKSAASSSDLVGPVDCSTPGKCVANPGTACTSNNDCPAGDSCNLSAYCDPGNGGGKDTDYCKYCYEGRLTNDANVLLKVKQDRVCGEWLYCAGSQTVWDKASGQSTEVCDQLARCQQLQTSGNTSACANLLIRGHCVGGSNPGASCGLDGDCPDGGSCSLTKVLDEPTYISRDVTWSGMDYSGYSLYGIYPPDLLTVKSYGMKCNNSGNSCTSDIGCPDGYCDNNYNLTYVDQGVGGKTCGGTNNLKCPSGQICTSTSSTVTGVCVAPKTCRAYPQVDAPFKQEAGELYDNLNLCQESDNASCQCFYQKVEYGQGSQIQYFNYKNNVIPSGVCTVVSDGHKIGDTCTMNKECGKPENGAICSFITKQTTALGLRGYCLEPDVTKPDALNACLTWWPGATTGDPDIYNQFPEAGYTAASNQGQVCANWMTPYGGEIVKECQDGWNQGKSCQNSNPDCPNWDYTDYFPCSLVNKSGWGIDPLVAGKATGFFPDQNTTTDFICLHSYEDRNPYLKSFYLEYKKGEATNQTFSYGIIDNNAFGLQDNKYTHTGLDNITLGMIQNIYINVCADFGGDGQTCGGCNDLNWGYVGAGGNYTPYDKVTTDSKGNILYWRQLDPKLDESDNVKDDINKNCYAYSAYNSAAAEDKKGVDPDGTHQTFVFEACFGENDQVSIKDLASSTTLHHLTFKMLRAENQNNIPTMGGEWLIVRGFLFQFNSGCQYILNVADGINPSPAFTNRVNNKQNYYGASEQLDDGVCKGTITPCSSIKPCSQGTCIYKKYSSACQPWGAVQLNGSSPSTFVVGDQGDTTCNLNLVAYTSVYKDATPINQNLFIKDYNAWYFNETTFSYLPSSTYDRRNQESATKAPKIFSVHQNPQTQQYQLGNEGAITVGNTDSQNIDRQGNYVANLKFYGRADTNHMPIRELIIDWGDKQFYGRDASLQAKNHVDTCQQKRCQLPDADSYYCYYDNGGQVARVDCDADTAISCSQGTDCTVGKCTDGSACDPHGGKPCRDGSTCVSPSCLIRGFSDSPEACAEQFWQFSHTYVCPIQGLRACTGPGDVNCFDGQVCIFKPKVYIKDNWGWCSGVQSQCSPPGCYAGDPPCQSVLNAGTPFTGRIIIRPPQSGGGVGEEENPY